LRPSSDLSTRCCSSVLMGRDELGRHGHRCAVIGKSDLLAA
jgi:hypothetical protein